MRKLNFCAAALLLVAALDASAQVVVVPPGGRRPGGGGGRPGEPGRGPGGGGRTPGGAPPVVVRPPNGRPPVVVVPPYRPRPRPVPRPVYPVPVMPPPVYRPAPYPFPPAYPGSYVQLEGYVQTRSYRDGRLDDFAVQVMQTNGYESVTLYPETTCRDPYYGCSGRDRTPITLWVFERSDVGCGAIEYVAVEDNAYSGVSSVVLTDRSRSYCGDYYRDALTLVVNYSNGYQDYMTGYRTR